MLPQADDKKKKTTYRWQGATTEKGRVMICIESTMKTCVIASFVPQPWQGRELLLLTVQLNDALGTFKKYNTDPRELAALKMSPGLVLALVEHADGPSSDAPPQAEKKKKKKDKGSVATRDYKEVKDPTVGDGRKVICFKSSISRCFVPKFPKPKVQTTYHTREIQSLTDKLNEILADTPQKLDDGRHLAMVEVEGGLAVAYVAHAELHSDEEEESFLGLEAPSDGGECE